MEKLEKKLASLDSRRASIPMLELQAELQAHNPQCEGICERSFPSCQETWLKPCGDRAAAPVSTGNKIKKRDEENEIEELVADLGYM